MPENSLIRLQQVQNSLARVIMPSCVKFDHVGPVLSGLHWLPVEKRITFKLATPTFKTWKTDQPSYLWEVLQWYVPPRSLRLTGKKLLVLPDILNQLIASAPSPMLHRQCGILCRKILKVQ